MATENAHFIHKIRVLGLVQGELDGLCEQPFRAFLADPVAPARERGRIDGWAMLEEGLAAEMLVIWVLHPARDHNR